MKYLIHWIAVSLDLNYQEHYWYAVKEREFQWGLISSICDTMAVNKRKIDQDRYRKNYHR